MEPFIIYLAKASGLIAVFFLAYTTFLKKETFFIQNRFFLLAGLFTAALLPFVVYTKIIWVDSQPAVAMQQINLDNLMVAPPATPEPFTINWFYVAVVMYGAGVIFFLSHFINDIYKVHKMLRREDAYVKDGFKFIDSDIIQSPFSFFKYIVYNSATLQPQELKDIIAHEKVHSSQGHSADTIISQLFCIAFWFNPFVWMYKKAISQNLEFIADAHATKNIADKKAYQKTLLKITVQPECIAITNHFYQSLIKKRIVMLNKQQSKRRNFYKYALVLPALVGFVVLFQVEVLAQEKELTSPQTTSSTSEFSDLRIVMDVTKDAKTKELEAETAVFKQEFDADVSFTKIKRNAKGEITAIMVTVKDKDNQKSYPVREIVSDDDSPIETFTIDIRYDSKTGKNIINFGEPKRTDKIKLPQGAVSTVTYVKKTDGSSKNGVYNAEDNDTIGHWSVNNIKFGGEDALIIIDGVKQKPGSTIAIPLGYEIDEMNVLKGNELKKYGTEGKNGVVLISTKKVVHTNSKPNTRKSFGFSQEIPAPPAPPSAVVYTTQPHSTNMQFVGNAQAQRSYTKTVTYTANNEEDAIQRLLESSTVNYKKAHILINGKPSTPAELERVNPKKVNITSVGIGTDALIAKYGQIVANGIITVELKGYESELTKTISGGVNKTSVADERDNVGYIIHKKSSKSDIKFYIKSLRDIGVNIKIYDVERNKQNEITSIKINMDDTVKGDEFTSSYSSDKGIHSIYVGRKSGKVIAYMQ